MSHDSGSSLMRRHKIQLVMDVLSLLSKTEMNTARDIALSEGVAEAGLQVILNGLEERGFLRRIMSKNGRLVYYELTAKGEDLLRLWIQLTNELIGVLPPDEILFLAEPPLEDARVPMR